MLVVVLRNAIALHVDPIGVRNHAHDLAFVDPTEHPLEEGIGVASVIVHQVEGQASRTPRHIERRPSIAIQIGKAEHMARFVDERGSRHIRGGVVSQQARVPQALAVPRALVHLGRSLLRHRPFLAPPGASPSSIGAGEMQVHAVDVPIAVSIELRKVQSLVKRVERFDEQQVDVVLIEAALVFRLVVHGGSGDIERAVTRALIVRVQAFIRERVRAAAVDERIERFKRIVVGEGMIRERHAQRQHAPGADRGHAAFPDRGNRGAQGEHVRTLRQRRRLPGKSLLRQIG